MNTATRAAIIVTDEHSVAWSAGDEPLCYVSDTSEALLADLRALTEEGAATDIPGLRNAAARVRAAIGDES